MTILYINDEHCTSVEQLRSYFSETIKYDSSVFRDLLDYARGGEIAAWLREKGESLLADNVDSIDGSLGDRYYFSRLSGMMTGVDSNQGDLVLEKPDFLKCFKVDGVRQEQTSDGIAVNIQIKVLSSVNEPYEICVRTSWGNKAKVINPFKEKVGGILPLTFSFRKRPYVEFKDIALFADNKELKCPKLFDLGTDKMEFEVNGVRFKMLKIGCPQSLSEKTFYIGETLVTQNLWRTVMGDSSIEYSCQKPVITNRGFINVFLDKINKITGNHFRLPYASEWESAAVGIKNKLNRIDKYAWYKENSNGELHDVATKLPDDNGLSDMVGNVWEYTRDACDIYLGGDYSTAIDNQIPLTVTYPYTKCGFRLALSEISDETLEEDYVDLGLSVLWQRSYDASGRFPSNEECKELFDKCTIIMERDMLVKIIGPSGQYIYLRSASWYWTAEEGRKSNSHYAFNLTRRSISDIYRKHIKNIVLVRDK